MSTLAACSSGGGDVTVIESVTAEERTCGVSAGDGRQCLRITAVVIGDEAGQGRCLLYASGEGRNLFVAADTGTVELQPGRDLEWDVAVEIPSQDEFDGWKSAVLTDVGGLRPEGDGACRHAQLAAQ